MMREKLEALAKGLDCGDHSCRYAVDKTGMRTNGGCRCTVRQVTEWGIRMRDAILASAPEPSAAGTEWPGLREAVEAIHAKHYRGPLDFKDDQGVQVGVSMVKADLAKALAAPQGEKLVDFMAHGRLQHNRIKSIQDKAREIDLLCCALTNLEPVTFDETRPSPADGAWQKVWDIVHEIGIHDLSKGECDEITDRILALTAPTAPSEGVRAWKDLTADERKEWNDGVRDDGRHIFQSFDHAYRLIVGRPMPQSPASYGKGEKDE